MFLRLLVLSLALCAWAADAHAVRYVYDQLGRLVLAVDDAGNATTYVYDAAGNLLSVTRGAAGQVAVLAFTPSFGKPDDEVTIIGSGFLPGTGLNTVSFNGTSATVLSATATTIVARVPQGATSGPATVSNAAGSATSTARFTVLAPPVIAAVSPQILQRGAANRVTISGTNLEFATSATFDHPGITATVVPGRSDAALPLRVTVASDVPIGDYAFSVANAVGTSASGSVTVQIGDGPLGPVLTHSGAISVLMRQESMAPSGLAAGASVPVSVLMPTGPLAPAGAAASAAQPVSVHLPRGPLAPSGDGAAASQTIGVSMP